MDHMGAVRCLYDMAVVTYLKQQSDKIAPHCVPLHTPRNTLTFKCYLQQGGATSGGIWGQLKSAGIINHPVSPPSKPNSC